MALGHTVCKTYFYADDLAIGTTVTDDLENVMRVLEKYCSENYLNVSIDKTKVAKFRNGGPLAQGDQLRYRNDKIEFVKNFCYLGVLLSTTLSPRQHLQHTKKALNAVNSLKIKLNVSKISIFMQSNPFVDNYALRNVWMRLIR